jgi:hypothetical protein
VQATASVVQREARAGPIGAQGVRAPVGCTALAAEACARSGALAHDGLLPSRPDEAMIRA